MSASNSLIYLRDSIFGEFLDRREGLTEIAVNRPNQIYTKEKGIWIPHDVDLSYQDCADLLQPLSNYSNNYIGDDSPILSATLHTGERVQAILPPVCLDGHISITIRKPSDVFISHEDFVKQGFYSRLNHPEQYEGHCCKVSDEAAFCLIQRPYISKTLLTRRISPRGSP